jgi:1-deoxy-D-xylulose-5-phosphate reductoisomerase
LRLAYQAIDTGGIMPTVLNAANEIAVEAFLREQIRFTDIPIVIEECMKKYTPVPAENLDTILRTDNSARDCSNEIIQQLK